MKPSGHSAVMADRQPTEAGDRDYFPTPPWAARAGGELIKRLDPDAVSCWEPACGGGHMAWGLLGYFSEPILCTDIHDYGFGGVMDFLGEEASAPELKGRYDWIVTNPPFSAGEAFVRAALRRAKRGVAMLLRSVFLEGAGRNPIFTDPALGFACHAQFAERVPMVKGRWDPGASTATAYSWFVWVKAPMATGQDSPQFAISQARAIGGHLGLVIPPGTKARLSKRADLERFCGDVGGELFGSRQ